MKTRSSSINKQTKTTTKTHKTQKTQSSIFQYMPAVEPQSEQPEQPPAEKHFVFEPLKPIPQRRLLSDASIIGSVRPATASWENIGNFLVGEKVKKPRPVRVERSLKEYQYSIDGSDNLPRVSIEKCIALGYYDKTEQSTDKKVDFAIAGLMAMNGEPVHKE